MSPTTMKAGVYPPIAGIVAALTSFSDPIAVALHELAVTQSQAAALNSDLASDYHVQMAEFLTQYNAERVTAEQAPQVPLGYLVQVDGPTSANEWNIVLVRTGPPVCDATPLPQRINLASPSKPNFIHVVKALSDGWFSAGQDDTFFPGGVTPPVTTDDGTTGTFEKFAAPVGPGWYKLITKLAALLIACALLFAPRPARAQVAIACSPQPIVSMSSLGKSVMGEWACFVVNSGTAARSLGVEEFYSAVLQIHPISPNVALQILTDRQARTLPAKIVTAIDKVAKPLGPPVGAVLTMVSKSNAVTGVIIAAASQSFGMLADPLVGIVQSQVPSITSYTADLMQAPLQLPPGGGATRVIYCAKQKNPEPLTVKLP